VVPPFQRNICSTNHISNRANITREGRERLASIDEEKRRRAIHEGTWLPSFPELYEHEPRRFFNREHTSPELDPLLDRSVLITRAADRGEASDATIEIIRSKRES